MENLSIYQRHPPYMPKTRESGPIQTNYNVYNNETVHVIENLGHVTMLFLKIQIAASASTTFSTPTSPYLFEEIYLESSGNKLARISTLYTLSRINEFVGHSLFDEIINASTLVTPFDTTVQTITLPLFFFAIDGQAIDLNTYPNLTVRAITKTQSDMPFNNSLNSLNVNLFAKYRQLAVPKSLKFKNEYNMYQVSPITLPVALGTTDVRFKLNVPFDVINMFFMIRKTSSPSNLGLINSVTVDCPTSNIGFYDNLTNYDLQKTTGTNEGSTYAIPFGSRIKSEQDTYLKLNGNMNPILCIMNYTLSAAVEYKLFVCIEYTSYIDLADGIAVEIVKESFVKPDPFLKDQIF